jgi:hypothetical protein
MRVDHHPRRFGRAFLIAIHCPAGRAAAHRRRA